jgi:AcrR family transcriptional regulator
MAADEGLAAVSLRRLAGSLGVTAPALYAHFSGKDELLEAVAEEEFTRLMTRLVEATEGIAAPVDRVVAQCHAYVDHALEHPALFQAMTRFRPAWAPQPAAPELPIASKAFELSAAAVQDAIDARDFGEPDVLLASLTLWSAVHGVATVLLARPGLDAADERALVDSVISSVVEGLRHR